MDLEEFWIDKIKNKYIGDDAAIIGNKIFAMDAFWEDTHFKKEWMSAKEIAYKSFIVNYSDMIAMNAKVKYMLITLVIPKNTKKEFLINLANEFIKLSKKYKIDIIGGDTIKGNKIGICITMIGESKNPLKRDGIKNKDLIAYTGNLGSVKEDLEKLFKGKKISKKSKFFKPMIRENFMKKASKYLSAAMDISDGLYCDTNKFFKANKLYFKRIKKISKKIGESGEEYELLIAFNPKYLKKIEKIAKKTKTPLMIFAQATKKRNLFFPCKSHHF